MTDLAPVKGMTEARITATVDAILAATSLEEKVAMMSGKGFFAEYQASGGLWGSAPYRAGGGCDRLGIPALYFTDGPRGVARGQSTCFPCTMARGASFDTDLEQRIGTAMAIEIRAQGCNLSGAVCINLLRHPAWGRAQETYGEDSHHLGAMGAALGTGLQSHNVIATVKHFALNSMENARFTVDVRIDERTLHEVYLPHFKAVLDAGVASVMSAYNKVNGEYCGQHRELLTDILRHQWGFDGFVHSDWIKGVYAPYGAAAGLDIENPEPRVFGRNLVAAVEAGSIEPHVIDTACRRILTVGYRFAAAEDPLENYGEDLVACAEHRALAREAADKSAVLLVNDGVLPLDRANVRRIALLGRLATLPNTGDNGSSKVRAPYVVTAHDGLAALLGEGVEILAGDESDLSAATVAAAQADAVIIVTGYTAREEGEYITADFAALDGAGNGGKAIGGDRLDLGLPPAQIALIEAAAASGKPVIVVIVAGSAVLVEDWLPHAAAVMQTFYSGMEGGHALAALLFGDVVPSGKLPFSVALDASDYPFFDRDAVRITYGRAHGYSHFDATGATPRFAFGHGLSYTRFAYRALKLRATPDTLHASVAVRNTGDRDADEIVQLYVSYPGNVAHRPAKALKAFARIHIPAGATRIVALAVARTDLRWWDPAVQSWRDEPGAYAVHVGGSSTDFVTRHVTL